MLMNSSADKNAMLLKSTESSVFRVDEMILDKDETLQVCKTEQGNQLGYFIHNLGKSHKTIDDVAFASMFCSSPKRFE